MYSVAAPWGGCNAYFKMEQWLRVWGGEGEKIMIKASSTNPFTYKMLNA